MHYYMGKKICFLSLFILLLGCCPVICRATPYNIAPKARASASSSIDAGHDAAKVIDGVIRVPGKGEWVSASTETFWGQIDYPWIQLDWDHPVNINKVILYDRPSTDAHIAGGVLHFSDGSKINVWGMANNGTPKEVEFESRKVEWIRFEVTDAAGTQVRRSRFFLLLKIIRIMYPGSIRISRQPADAISSLSQAINRMG